jgi:general nucleoside transport system ATP-binding protein
MTEAGRSSTPVAGEGKPPPAVEILGVSKRFGPVLACDDVNLTVERGVIRGLLGQNGAGKTTLMKILTGLLPPDGGAIRVDGVDVTINDPLTAAKFGIAMVHQHFSLIGALTVWENVTLGESGRVDRQGAIDRVEQIAERYGLGIDPHSRVEDLSTGARQRVEIVKCLRRDPSVVVLDEPTSVLTLNESKVLFSVLRRVVQEEGKAVVLISHKLDEILEATDEVTIMREGRVVREMRTADADARLLAREMVGRDVVLRNEAAALGMIDSEVTGSEPGEVTGVFDAPVADVASTAAMPLPTTPAPGNGQQASTNGHGGVLSLRNVVVNSAEGRVLLDDLTLHVNAGEVLGIAGVEGNGQTALCDLLSSLIGVESGGVYVDGESIRCGKPGCMLRANIGVIPEDRHNSGCVLSMTVAENLVMSNLDQVAPRRILNVRKMRRHAARLIREFEIMCPSPETPMASLSGGNQQKVVLARELSRNPKVLVASQPTRGLDVGAIEYMNNRIRRAADQGVAVLLISAELEELLAISDRVAVMYRGRIMGEMKRGEVDLERLGMWMGGHEA